MEQLLDRLGLEHPIVQAGMGGGLARHELAAAVSEAGGLGTIGMTDAPQLRRELMAARERTGRPIAVNLLLPFARRAHWAVASEAEVVVTFWGRPRRRTERPWVHQCGSVAEAQAAHAAGADAVIVQGVEAGGHVRGHLPAVVLLEAVRARLPHGFPVLLAGGLADAADVRAAREAGAEAAVLGTRFLMTEESWAHQDYKRRLVEARETILTELFSAGWPAPHRVIRNSATERWLRRDERGPAAVRMVNRLTAPALRRLPAGPREAVVSAQRPGRPLFSPVAPTRDRGRALLDSGPLYAGESVARIEDVRSVGEVMQELAGDRAGAS